MCCTGFCTYTLLIPFTIITRTMATSQINNTSPDNNNTINFSAADFQRWNQTTSVVNIPSRLVKQSKIPQLRKELINAIGERKVAAVQALSPTRYRIEYRYSSDWYAADINGIAFQGIQLTPLPAYEEVKSVFDTLAPYGRVISVQHLKVKGFPSVRSGMRRVSMVITKPIPANINIGGFSVSFRYRGQPPTCFVCQEVGHTGRGCPKLRQARKSAENNNIKRPTGDGSNNSKKPSAQPTLKVKTDGKTRVVTTTKPSSKPEEDLREKLNAKRAATTATKDQAANTAQTHLPQPNNIAVDEPQNEQTAHLMEIEPFSSPPNRWSLNAKHQRYTWWDGSQAVILSPTVTAPSSPEPNGPAPATISMSPPAAHLAALRQIFHLPQTSEEPETGDVPSSSVEEQFEALAEQSRSVAGYDATCTRSFVRGTSISRAFYRERLLCTYTVPVTSSFAFNVNASVAAPTSVPLKSARNRQCGGKASLFDGNVVVSTSILQQTTLIFV